MQDPNAQPQVQQVVQQQQQVPHGARMRQTVMVGGVEVTVLELMWEDIFNFMLRADPKGTQVTKALAPKQQQSEDKAEGGDERDKAKVEDKAAASAMQNADLIVSLKSLIPKCIEGKTHDGQSITYEHMLKWSPSQTDVLWQAFKTVNARFLAICGSMGFSDVVKETLTAASTLIQTELRGLLPDLFAQAMHNAGITGTGFSGSASQNSMKVRRDETTTSSG